LSSSTNIRVIKPRDVRWAGHVASNTQNGNAYRVFVWKPGVNSDRLEDLRLDEKNNNKMQVK